MNELSERHVGKGYNFSMIQNILIFKIKKITRRFPLMTAVVD